MRATLQSLLPPQHAEFDDVFSLRWRFYHAAQFSFTGSLALPESLSGPVVPFPFGTALLQTISFDLHGSDDRAKTCFRISVDFCGLSLTEQEEGTGRRNRKKEQVGGTLRMLGKAHLRGI